MSKGWRTAAVVLCLMIAVALPAAATERAVAGFGGVFQPYDGQVGVSAGARVTFPFDERWSLGGEVEYRNFRTQIFKVDEVRVQAIAVRAVALYFLRPTGISPYLGAGLGLDFNLADDGRIERKRSDLREVDAFSFGGGVLGLAGIELPLGDHLSAFGEARVAGDVGITDDSKDISVENLGGVAGVLGLRFAF